MTLTYVVKVMILPPIDFFDRLLFAINEIKLKNNIFFSIIYKTKILL